MSSQINLRVLVMALTLVAMVAAVGLRADEIKEKVEEVSTDKLASGKMRFEVGGAGGFPLGVGAQAGLWNIASTPLFFRAAFGFNGIGVTAEGELGGLLLRESAVAKPYISAVGGYYAILFQEGAYIGPQVGVVLWDTLTLSGGAAYFSTHGNGSLFLSSTSTFDNFLPFGKVSVSFFF
jgi:hypothetical protein